MTQHIHTKKLKECNIFTSTYSPAQAGYTPYIPPLLSFPVWSAPFTFSLIWASFIPPLRSCAWLWSLWLGTNPFYTGPHCSLSSTKSRAVRFVRTLLVEVQRPCVFVQNVLLQCGWAWSKKPLKVNPFFSCPKIKKIFKLHYIKKTKF